MHYPEIYVLEGGYCEYFKHTPDRCEPRAYIQMDDPQHKKMRNDDLDQFRKGKFGRTKSYAYGESKHGMMAAPVLHQPKHISAPGGIPSLFAAGNIARSRRSNNTSLLQTLEEDSIEIPTDDDEDDTDLGDSPCPQPTKGMGLSLIGKRLPRGTLHRAETYGPSRTLDFGL